MPRDDLSIDFVKKMPQTEPMDPAVILDEWFNRVQNLPEEVRFIQDEVADKDRQYAECIRIAEDRDGKIQKWIKNQGSHEPNPKEDQLRSQVRENYARAEKIAAEKLVLTNRLQAIMDKHLRSLDVQIKLLYDRAEPGFLEPNEVPSLLRPSPANKAVPSLSLRNPSNLAALGASPTATSAGGAPHTPVIARASTTQIRHAQASHQHAVSAPVSPAASMILNRNQREASTGAASQKRPRLNTGGNSNNTNSIITTSSLARHSSLGPGTPKGITGTTIAAGVTGGAIRAGSAGPRVAAVKASSCNTGGRKSGTPSSAGRKRGVNVASSNPKSSLSRVRKSTKTSPASTGDSELSDADSGSDMSDNDGGDSASAAGAGSASGAGSSTSTTHGPTTTGPHDGASSRSASGTNGSAATLGAHVHPHTVTTVASNSTPSNANAHVHTPGSGSANSNGSSNGGGTGAGAGGEADEDEEMGDADYDEAGDNKKYCLCQKVSFGDMVACDYDNCPYEWFHWSCVGLVSEPNGKWYCPVCEEKRQK
ncbi:Chromatin modification-related protein YNG2 [Ceratocystis platani]|uniref:Chromatin modification-related protein n=1 Tax=Ceratocystis fimbriata f. sp. platani TaxID=88771 RepID=A0A0F8B4A1_CERFI|nr:Chromatin modification-related protein YNG2 [Ceratocystis platani]